MMSWVLMVVGWILPPLTFLRQFRQPMALLASAIWLMACACTVLLWAGPGLVAMLFLSCMAGALELRKW
jgi:hypothetical protein